MKKAGRNLLRQMEPSPFTFLLATAFYHMQRVLDRAVHEKHDFVREMLKFLLEGLGCVYTSQVI